jgi:hypothetical protein
LKSTFKSDPFLTCKVPTLFRGSTSLAAAKPVPPSATNSAIKAMTVAGDGRRTIRFMYLTSLACAADATRHGARMPQSETSLYIRTALTKEFAATFFTCLATGASRALRGRGDALRASPDLRLYNKGPAFGVGATAAIRTL